MSNIKITYSNITEEQLDKYWENKPKRNTKEAMIRIPLELFLTCVALYVIGYAHYYTWPYLLEDYTVRTIIIFIMLIYFSGTVGLIFINIDSILCEKFFPNYCVRSQYTYAKNDLNWTHKLYRLQRLLKEGNLSKITSRETATLIVELTEENGIFKEQEVQLELYYERVVKEDSLDFSWMDEEINKVLAKNKLPELV